MRRPNVREFFVLLILLMSSGRTWAQISFPVYDPEKDKSRVVAPVYDPEKDKTRVVPAIPFANPSNQVTTVIYSTPMPGQVFITNHPLYLGPVIYGSPYAPPGYRPYPQPIFLPPCRSGWRFLGR